MSYPDRLQSQLRRILELVTDKDQPDRVVKIDCSFCHDSGWVETTKPGTFSKCERCKPKPVVRHPEREVFS